MHLVISLWAECVKADQILVCVSWHVATRTLCFLLSVSWWGVLSNHRNQAKYTAGCCVLHTLCLYQASGRRLLQCLQACDSKNWLIFATKTACQPFGAGPSSLGHPARGTWGGTPRAGFSSTAAIQGSGVHPFWCGHKTQNHKKIWVGRDQQGSVSPALQWVAHAGVEPQTCC